MNRIVVGGLSGLASGALYGAIGAGVAEGARDKPVLKGAAVSGIVGGVLATVTWAIIAGRQAEQQLAGPKTASASDVLPNSVQGVYFP
jgi:hypothetical protein